MYCTSVLFQCIRLQNLRTRKKGTVCHRGVFATPGDMPCLVCFVNQLFINFGIPSDHASFLHKQCNNVDAFGRHLFLTSPCLSNKNIEKLTAIYCTNFFICVRSSFVGKFYTYHRSEHSPGVRFCKHLLVHLAISPLLSVLCPFR